MKKHPEKPKLGFFSFSCCEGCQVTLFQLEGKFTKVFELVDVNASRLLKERSRLQGMDVAVVEGSIIGRKAVSKLKAIRKKAKFLIAFGACATEGGIPAIRNSLPKSEKQKIAALFPKQAGVGKVSDFVKVDYNMRGCPVSGHEILKVLLLIAHGARPVEIQAPVCTECKMRETPCLLLQKKPCLGPVSNAGCNAPCPAEGFHCNACRGLNEDGNYESLKSLLKSFGVGKTEMSNLFTIFNSPTAHGQKPVAYKSGGRQHA